MKLVIAGSRHFKELDLSELFPDFTLTCGWVAEEYLDFDKITEIVHGGCPTGVDDFANFSWDEYWDIIPTKVFEADWDKYGKRAGPRRNKEMAEYGDGLFLIWDGKSKGSASMKKEMQKLGKPIYEIILRRTE